MSRGRRLDERVVSDGLAESRARAQALILAGDVLVDDEPVTKAGQRVRDTSHVRLRASVRRYVSRGGEKLEGALSDLGVDVAGRRALDVGASTGGFSDCLLQAGAASVVALDVGHGQLHSRLRADPRVHVLEKTNARELTPEALPGPIDLVVVDVSFISIRLLLPALASTAPDADWLFMVKPQFEVGREDVGKGGVVRDDALRHRAADEVARAAAEHGRAEAGRAESRIPGPKGNREIFLWLPARSAEELPAADAPDPET